MTPGARVACLVALLAAGAVGGCGQQGPLVLPPDARPIERVEPPVDQDEQTDDEPTNER